MLFQSIEFLFLFPLALLLRYLLPKSLEKLILVAFSYLFYSWWSLKFVFLLFISTFVDYFCSKAITSTQCDKKRKFYLALSIFVNLGILFLFKYFVWVSGLFGQDLAYSIILPLGISFYTFQSMSYTIDVFKGDTKPEKDFMSFAAFVSFFPQLVAGPIERASRLLSQINNGPKYINGFVRSGLSLFAWGLIKKVVFADHCAELVNFSYGIFENQSSLELLLSSYAFALQIYCDFSGYTDMARGIARLMGYELIQNFNLPYFASNIRDFWHKWHISLSTWFRDYVYIPLGGNRCGKVQNYFNIFLTMLIAGVWHGANMTFVVWGALHGIGIVIYDFSHKALKNLIPENFITKFFSVLITFHFVLLGWIYFRAESIEKANFIVGKILEFDFSLLEFNSVYHYMLSFFILMALRRYTKIEAWLSSRPFINWCFIWLGGLAVIIFGSLKNVDFIYFDF